MQEGLRKLKISNSIQETNDLISLGMCLPDDSAFALQERTWGEDLRNFEIRVPIWRTKNKFIILGT